MKNKWFLLLVVLMIFVNNLKSLAQNEFNKGEGYQIEESWTAGRIIDFPIKCKNCWIDDTLDLIFSVEKQNIKDSIINAGYFHKADDKTIDSLLAIVTSIKKDQISRNDALYALSYIDNRRYIPVIERMIFTKPCDTCYDIRNSCIETLILANSKSSIPLLINILDKINNYSLKFKIASFLAYNGEKTISFNILKHFWLLNIGKKNECHTCFVKINTPESIDILRVDIKDSNPLVAIDAAACMAILNYKEEAFPIIKNLLLNEDNRIRISAMRVLAYFIGDKTSFDLIKQMQNDKNSDVRWYCQALIKKYKIK